MVGYNLELFGGRLHTDVGFAVCLGRLPRSSPATSPRPSASTSSPCSARAAAFGLSYAQRRAEHPARLLRRRVASVEGSLTLDDGTVAPLDDRALLGPLERALRALSWSMVALALGLAAARLI